MIFGSKSDDQICVLCGSSTNTLVENVIGYNIKPYKDDFHHRLFFRAGMLRQYEEGYDGDPTAEIMYATRRD